LRKGLAQCLKCSLGSLTSCDALLICIPCWELVSVARWKLTGVQAIEQSLVLRVGSCPLIELDLPCSLLLCSALCEGAGVRDDLIVDREVSLRIESKLSLGCCNLSCAKSSTVH